MLGYCVSNASSWDFRAGDFSEVRRYLRLGLSQSGAYKHVEQGSTNVPKLVVFLGALS